MRITIELPCEIGATCYVHPTPENELKHIVEMKCLGFEISNSPHSTANLFSKNRSDKKAPKMYQPSFGMFGISVFVKEN